MMLGISATQAVQLVAQKLTSITRPLRSSVVLLEPSSSTNVDCGAAELPLPTYPANPIAARAAAAATYDTLFNSKALPWIAASLVRLPYPR
jgi:hypothetical protein